jgi:Holliday junction resolvasome RuvABC endonuclease subunit
MSARDVVLGLDLATSSGWAVLTLAGELEASGSFVARPRNGEHPGARWLRFRSGLIEVLAGWHGRIGAVSIERPFQSSTMKGGTKRAGTRATAVAWGLRAHADALAASRHIDVVDFAGASLKKELAGNGKASKPEIITEARRRWGPLSSSLKQAREDESFARASAWCALQRLDLEALRCGRAVLL